MSGMCNSGDFWQAARRRRPHKHACPRCLRARRRRRRCCCRRGSGRRAGGRAVGHSDLQSMEQSGGRTESVSRGVFVAYGERASESGVVRSEVGAKIASKNNKCAETNTISSLDLQRIRGVQCSLLTMFSPRTREKT